MHKSEQQYRNWCGYVGLAVEAEPTEKYRVRWEFRSSAPGCYGWTSSVEVFDSLEAAEHAADTDPRTARARSVLIQRDTGRSWQKVKTVKGR